LRTISRASLPLKTKARNPGEMQLRYFVNVTANEAVLQDASEGFSDLYEACTHAVELAAELLTQYPQKVKNMISGVPLAVEVVDCNGAILFRSPVG
jgi:hypothetical protein